MPREADYSVYTTFRLAKKETLLLLIRHKIIPENSACFLCTLGLKYLFNVLLHVFPVHHCKLVRQGSYIL